MFKFTGRVKFILIFFIIFLLLFTWLMAKQEEKRRQAEIDSRDNRLIKDQPVKTLPNFSRISFFNTQIIKVSLAIPDYWEGLYRVREEGRVLKIFYIGQAPVEDLLFSVKLLNIDKDIIPNDAWEIYNNGEDVLVYYLSTDRDEKKQTSQEYKNMSNDVFNIIESIKIK